MQLYVDIDGSVKLTLTRDEIRNAGLSATLNKWVDAKLDEVAKTVSDQKALEYLNAVGDVSGRPITELVLPSKVIEFKEKEYLDNDNDYDECHNHGQWNCGNCGSPNTVSQDDGCTNCNY